MKGTKERPLFKPENFASDLPDIAWEVETVIVDGEERARVHHCPLASEWLEWSDPPMARLYCYVDQAKMKAYNPAYLPSLTVPVFGYLSIMKKSAKPISAS